MKINRIPDIRPETPDAPVTVKRCGNVVEVRYMAGSSPAITIEKLSADLYADKRTGEVKEFQHHDSRANDTASVSQSLRKLRDLINANLESPETALWVTLTYRENMTDPARLYEDYRRFWQRFKYYLDKQGHPPAEYIIAAEPQGRGAWHLHCLFLFPGKAPYCLPRKYEAGRICKFRDIPGHQVGREQEQEKGHSERRAVEFISIWF